MTNLVLLKGQTVQNVVVTEDEICLRFPEKSFFLFFNNYEFPEPTVFSLRGQKLVSVAEKDQKLFLSFSGGQDLVISLTKGSQEKQMAAQLGYRGSAAVSWSLILSAEERKEMVHTRIEERKAHLKMSAADYKPTISDEA